MKKLILLIVFLLTLCGCSSQKKVVTEYVDREVVVHDTIKDLRVDIIKDSIFLHDSIVVVRDTAGKTIYKERYVYRDLWHDADTKIVHDSIVVYRDKTEANKVEEKTVTKNKLNIALVVISGLALGILLIWIVKKLLR